MARASREREVEPIRLRVGRRGIRLRTTVLMVVVAACVTGAVPSRAWGQEYDSERAGQPLRVVAYVLHPVGLALDYLLFRPAYWIGSHEPFTTVFGRKG